MRPSHVFQFQLRLLLLALGVVGRGSSPVQAQPQPGADDSRRASTVIFLVDRSESIAHLPVPDTTEAMIVNCIQAARLARGETKFLAIVYSGQGVELIGGEGGKPTTAYQTLIQQVHDKLPSPNGGTPLTEALVRCRDVISKLPAEEVVTVLSTGDGQPTRPFVDGQNPKVDAYLKKRLEAITAGLQGAQQQKRIEAFYLELQNPQSREAQKLGDLMAQEELQICLKTAEQLSSSRVRYITIDFNGIAELKAIHDAAGGLPDDYVILESANLVIHKLHDLGVTHYEGTLVPPVIQGDASSEVRKNNLTVPLDDLADAAMVTIVLDEPVKQLGDELLIAVKVDGGIRKFELNGSDTDMMVATDSAGQVAMATVFLPSIPASRQISVGYKTQGKQALPAVKVYRHLRLRKDIQVIVKPFSVNADVEPPYALAPQQPVRWQAYLQTAGDAAPVEIRMLEATLVGRRQQKRLPLQLRSDANSPGVFSTVKPMTLSIGEYDVEVAVLLTSGEPLYLNLEDHIRCQPRDEAVTIELDDTSASSTCIDFDEIGDAVTQKSVSVCLRSYNVDYPLDVQLKVLDLTDEQGNLIAQDVVQATRTKVRLAPGRASKVKLKLNLPEFLGEIVDGPILGRLAISRVDSNLPLELRSYTDPSTLDEPADEVKFFLKRPRFSVRAKRGGRDELQRVSDSLCLPIHIDIWGSFHRPLQLQVGHDSEMDRNVSVVVRTPVRTEQGKSNKELTIVPQEDQSIEQGVAEKELVAWNYDIEIPSDLSARKLITEVQILSPGVQPMTVPVEFRIRKKLMAPTIQVWLRVLCVLAALTVSSAGIVLFRHRHFRPKGVVEARVNAPFAFIEVRRGKKKTAQLVVKDKDVRVISNNRPVPVLKPINLDGETVTPHRPLRLEKTVNKRKTTIDIIGVKFETGGPVLVCQVVRAGSLGRSRERARNSLRILVPVACLALGLAQLVYVSSVVAMLQLIWDTFRLG